MRKWAKRSLLLYLSAFLVLASSSPAQAELSIEDTRKLLQQSLSIVQIDEEISRITQEETAVTLQMIQTEVELTLQEKKLVKTRERLGKVLRSYYKGERASLWLLLFNAESFSQLLRMFDYLTYIYKSDQNALHAYREDYSRLQALNGELTGKKTDLAGLKRDFAKQRSRVLALQQEVDQALKDNPEAAVAVAAQIEQVKTEWREQGLPLFQKYFSAISGAMQQLPGKIIGDKENRYIKGTSLAISDADLTAMLRSANPELEKLTLTFKDGRFTARNTDRDLDASIVGYYTVEENPNRLQFHVEKLDYNGFPLDETTNRSLERDYDLSFTPGLVLPMLHAKEVSTQDGLLTVIFTIKF